MYVPKWSHIVRIPDTVTHIGEYAFSYCNEIEQIEFPESVQSFGNRAFYHLSNLKKVYFVGDTPESFKPILCCDFETVNLAQKVGVSDYNADELTIKFDSVPSGGKSFVVFYDYYGRVLGVKNGTNIDIPVYATSYEVFVMNESVTPLTFKVRTELE